MLSKPLGRTLAGVIVIVVVMVAWFLLQVDPIFHGKGKDVIVTVNDGESLSSVVGAMHAEGVIASTLAFQIDMTIFGSFQLGSRFRTKSTRVPRSPTRSIFSGPPNVVTVNVLAGQTLHEVAVNVVADGENANFGDKFIAVAKATKTPSPFHADGSEGLIGTGQYIITPGSRRPRCSRR